MERVDFGMQLKVARLRAGINQKELARIIGVKHQPLVSHWETGRFMPTEQYLKKLNQFLSLNPSVIKVVCIKGSRFEVTPDGLLYCPEGACSKKRHKCPDCYFCQWCSDSRCSLCRSQGKHPPQKPDRS